VTHNHEDKLSSFLSVYGHDVLNGSWLSPNTKIYDFVKFPHKISMKIVIIYINTEQKPLKNCR